MIGLYSAEAASRSWRTSRVQQEDQEAHLSKKQHESEIFDDFLAKI
jgi:hypothetical protein